MCTALAMVSGKKNTIFGRTMDFSHELDPEIYVIPRNYEWNNAINNFKIINKYKIIGTGQDIGKIILADGINECGLGVATLYFQNYAFFNSKINPNIPSIGSIEVVNYLLGSCGNIDEVILTVNNIQIVGIEDKITNSIAPLHWFITDSNGKCITMEITKEGLKIYENPIKVLSNSPDFKWHMTNLNNYLNLSTKQPEVSKWNNLNLILFSQGAGTIGLPGDYTSPSRFVRVAFQKTFIQISDTDEDCINACFHVMESVTIPKGIVITNKNNVDYTQYTVVMNNSTGDYYFKTYDNLDIRMANINDSNSHEIKSLGKLKDKKRT